MKFSSCITGRLHSITSGYHRTDETFLFRLFGYDCHLAVWPHKHWVGSCFERYHLDGCAWSLYILSHHRSTTSIPTLSSRHYYIGRELLNCDQCPRPSDCLETVQRVEHLGHISEQLHVYLHGHHLFFSASSPQR